MPERNMAHVILDFQVALDKFKAGDINIVTLTAEFEVLKHRVGCAAARYCDDFSAGEYHQILKQLETKDATD
jgi:hypothetical protein